MTDRLSGVFSFISCLKIDIFTTSELYFVYCSRPSWLHQIIVAFCTNPIFYICLNVTVYRKSFKTKPHG